MNTAEKLYNQHIRLLKASKLSLLATLLFVGIILITTDGGTRARFVGYWFMVMISVGTLVLYESARARRLALRYMEIRRMPKGWSRDALLARAFYYKEHFDIPDRDLEEWTASRRNSY